jgi:hypothetical protein
MTQTLVLIADDNTQTHRLLHTALGSVEVRTTVSGREAFTIAAKDCPELIVANLGLEAFNGFDLVTATQEGTSNSIHSCAGDHGTAISRAGTRGTTCRVRRPADHAGDGSHVGRCGSPSDRASGLVAATIQTVTPEWRCTPGALRHNPA